MPPPQLGNYSVRARARSWWTALPLATRGIFSLCTGLFVIGGLLGWENHSVCCGAWLAIGRGQLWRLFSSAFFHAGLLHWGMNMAALASLMPPVERAHGTPGAVVLTLCYAALGQALALIPATLLYGVTGIESAFGVVNWRDCSLGMSGILFALLTLEATTDDTGLLRHRIVCGFAIPSGAYPWLLLLVVQVLMPNASLMGHLGGICAAHLVNPLRLRGPTAAVDSLCPQRVKAADAYVPANRVPITYAPPESAALQGGLAWLSRVVHGPPPPPPGGDARFPGQGRSLAPAEDPPSSDRAPPGGAVVRNLSPGKGGGGSGEAVLRSPQTAAQLHRDGGATAV